MVLVELGLIAIGVLTIAVGTYVAIRATQSVLAENSGPGDHASGESADEEPVESTGEAA